MHSLPVHQSMSVPWEFFSSSHFISQFPPTRFPLITAIRMCHLLPVHHLGMAFLAGSKGQNITFEWFFHVTYPFTCVGLLFFFSSLVRFLAGACYHISNFFFFISCLFLFSYSIMESSSFIHRLQFLSLLVSFFSNMWWWLYLVIPSFLLHHYIVVLFLVFLLLWTLPDI